MIAGALTLLMLLTTSAAAAAPGGVVVLPTLGLVGPDGRVPPPEVVDTVDRHLRAAAHRGRLGLAPWIYAGEGKVQVDASATVSALGQRPIPADIAALLAGAQKAKREFDQAGQVRHLRQAIEQMRKRLAEIGHVGPLLTAEVELAATYLGSGEPLYARNELGSVLAMRPGYELDLRRYPPETAEAFLNIKQQLLAQPKSSISIDVTPRGALIILDGLAVGETPKVLEIGGGLHLVQVRAQGHDNLDRIVQVEAGGQTAVHAALTPEPARRIADDLMVALRGRGERAQALEQARALARTVNASAVLASGVVAIKGGFALVTALDGQPAKSAIGTFGQSLASAAATCEALVDHLASAPAEGVALVSVEKPPLPVLGVALDLEKRLLGGVWAPFDPNLPPPDLAATGPAPRDAFHQQWWFRAGVAFAVVAGAGLGAWAITDYAYRKKLPDADIEMTLE